MYKCVNSVLCVSVVSVWYSENSVCVNVCSVWYWWFRSMLQYVGLAFRWCLTYRQYMFNP